MSSYGSIAASLEAWHWVGALVARVSVGLFFALTGWGKVTSGKKLEQMRDTMKDGGIPFPRFQSVFVSWVELTAGVLLLVGLLTPLASLTLLVVMVVAVATTKLEGVSADGVRSWLGQFLYLPDVLLGLLLVWLTLAPPVVLSADRLLGFR